MTKLNTITEKLDALNFSLRLSEYYEDGQKFNWFLEAIQDAINSEDIIYYSRAMEYLKENDPSLRKSMSLASELGFTPKNLNSEILATLLYQQNLNEELNELYNEIESIFEEEEEEDEE
jgi:aminopeptidase C